MPEKIIRDPVHDVIAFRLDRPGDALLFRLVNAAEFQRLRRVRQLGLASLAYPGADHSRYSHSLGVMETARKILARLRDVGHAIDPDAELLCVTGALLHDLGHGPFSHVFERVSGIDHERLTRRVILDPESEVHRLLFQHERTMPERVADFLTCQPSRTFYSDVVSSQLDADRFDYLLRDNLMTGSRYGDYDLAWLLHALTIDGASGRLAVTRKGVSAVEAYLQSRFHMYRNVYFHKVVRSGEGMVRLALRRARRLAIQGRLEWPPRGSGVYNALTGQRMSIADFTDLDDIAVLHCMKVWAKSADAPLAALCQGLLFRRLYKTIDLTDRGEEARLDAERAAQAIADAGGDGAYDLFYDEPSDTPYERYSAEGAGRAAEEILVCADKGGAAPLGAVSPLTMALNRQLMFRRVHVAPAMRDAVAAVLARG